MSECIRKQLMQSWLQANQENIGDIIKEETAAKFLRVLEDAGVFKRDDQGQGAFRQFIQGLNCIAE